MDHAGVVIVGAGAAGATAAGTLRRGGYAGRIVVIRGEDGRPYNRTTVNKALLQGLVSRRAVELPEAETPDIEWTGVDHAVGLDAAAHTVTLASGRSLIYENLIIATGAGPRPFPGRASGGARARMLTLRTANDTGRLRQLIGGGSGELGSGQITILGAGLLGAETASVLAGAGASVRLVSWSPTPMSEHLGRIAGTYLAALHERQVETHFGQTVTHADTDERHRVVATLTSGERVSSDVLLVSIGVTPNTGWLSGSGLDTSNGVAVDGRLRARGAAGVYAAGDLARMCDDRGAGHRVEHWSQAVAQGRHAASAVLHDLGIGEDPGIFDVVPTYSTRLYGTRVTIVGHPHSNVEETIIDGDPETGRFTVALTGEHHRLVGAVGVGGAGLVHALAPAVHANVALDAALALASVR
jgi:NADPH-dependent 2,4-dienoyl-CoA reductase/sulfur reductase-like enzyme